MAVGLPAEPGRLDWFACVVVADAGAALSSGWTAGDEDDLSTAFEASATCSGLESGVIVYCAQVSDALTLLGKKAH